LIEVNEKVLKIPISEFFIYDFSLKKYTNIGKGDFTIEYDKSDEKKQTPLLIFRNSVLKILFQGLFRGNLTKLETVNKNFKTISLIQKVLVINENTKKPEFKSVKMLHNNDQEAKKLSENFKELEENFTKNEEKREKNDKNVVKENEKTPNPSEEQRHTVSNFKTAENLSKGKNVQFEENVNKQKYIADDVNNTNNNNNNFKFTKGKIVSISVQVISPSKN